MSEERKLLREAQIWLQACLECKAYEWDADQRECAEGTVASITALLSAPAPEPVAWWRYEGQFADKFEKGWFQREMPEVNGIPLYTRPPASSWVRCEDKLPKEGENIWIAGCGNKGSFYSEAKYENGEWLMFDQVTDQHCWPCEYPDYWMPIEPLPPLPEDKQ